MSRGFPGSFSDAHCFHFEHTFWGWARVVASYLLNIPVILTGHFNMAENETILDVGPNYRRSGVTLTDTLAVTSVFTLNLSMVIVNLVLLTKGTYSLNMLLVKFKCLGA